MTENWTLLRPGCLHLGGTDFTITAEKRGGFAMRLKGKPFAGSGVLGYAKMAVVKHIEACAELGIECGSPDGTAYDDWLCDPTPIPSATT